MKKSVEEIFKKIEATNYWDARVLNLECCYFGDEVTLAFSDDDVDILLRFSGCYKAFFDHIKDYDKLRRVRDMTLPQIPYFLQNIAIAALTYEDVEFYSCKIEMFPLTLDILCKEICVEREVTGDTPLVAIAN